MSTHKFAARQRCTRACNRPSSPGEIEPVRPHNCETHHAHHPPSSFERSAPRASKRGPVTLSSGINSSNLQPGEVTGVAGAVEPSGRPGVSPSSHMSSVSGVPRTVRTMTYGEESSPLNSESVNLPTKLRQASIIVVNIGSFLPSSTTKPVADGTGSISGYTSPSGVRIQKMQFGGSSILLEVWNMAAIEAIRRSSL